MNVIKKLCYLIQTLPKKEKVFFWTLAAIFIISLAGIIWQLGLLSLIEIPAKGGELKEGIIGIPRFINPLLAISDADRDMSSLVYSGLLRIDENGELIPDLAEDYQISEDGLSYVFKIKKQAVWHDNKPITSDDIIFTIETAKNSLVKSPKQASWEGVEVEKINDKELKFLLKLPYAPFLENTTLGILPKHIWQKIPAEQFNLSNFNIKPIGSGPYKITEIIKDSAGITSSYLLEPNKKFVLARPFIKKLSLKFYPSEQALLKAFERGEIDSLSAISPQKMTQLKISNSKLKTLTLPRVFGVFFNQNQNPVLAKQEVRQALNLAVNKEQIISQVLAGYGEILESAIPPGVLGHLNLENPEPSIEKAKEKLNKAGWKYNEEERILEKKSKKETLQLKFSLATSNTPELSQTAQILKSRWEEMGAKVNLEIFEIGGLNQNIIRPREYDALLFGMVVGRDPDPFAFWHSSQRNDPGLNIALYANITVDKLLEQARTTFNPEERKSKYQEFQKELSKDQPAIFLYSPYYLYIIPKFLKGVEAKNITIPSERFSQIHKWHIKTKKIWKN